MLSSYGFSQLISGPTRVIASSMTLLDAISYNKSEQVASTGVLYADLISDQFLVTFCILKHDVENQA